jgi:hypothetical protein
VFDLGSRRRSIMHNKLLKVLQSAQPEAVKKKSIEEIKCAGIKNANLSASQFNAMLQCCCDIAANEESQFAVDASSDIFLAWASHNWQMFCTFFDAAFVVKLLLDSKSKYTVNTIGIVDTGLGILQQSSSKCYDSICEILWKQASSYIEMRSTEFFAITKFCKLMTKHVTCIPNRQERLELCRILVCAVMQWSHQLDKSHILKYVNDVRGSIGYLLNEMWQRDIEAAQTCCEYIFQNVNENVCLEAVGCLVQYIPDSAVITVLTTIANSSVSSVKNNMFISYLLYHLIMWLLLPYSENVSYWIVHFIRSLVKERKIQNLMEVAEWSTLSVSIHCCILVYSN